MLLRRKNRKESGRGQRHCERCYSQTMHQPQSDTDIPNHEGIFVSMRQITAMISKEELDAIEQAMNSLPPKCKEIFFLAKLDGYSYQEIADQLKITSNTVKKQIAIAKDKLRKTLENT